MVAAALPVTDDQRQELVRIAGSSVLPHRQVVQAQALLWAADGVANEEIARRSRGGLGHGAAVAEPVRGQGGRRCRRDREGSGSEVVAAAGHGAAGGRVDPDRGSRPGGATHWTTRTLAAQVGVGKDTVAQIWSDHQLQPWRVDAFKISNDPEFEQKLVDVVGVYLKPPARAVVFSFDEKTQCQALDRTQPSLPMKPGRAGTMTHDYKRHGTIDLFAAMNVGTGQVHTHLRKGHTGADVLAFFKQIDATVERGLSVHVILDNLSAHKAPEVRKWLAHRDRRRWHLHFTPTSSSWLNLVERWFKELTDKRLRRGVFTSVADLTEAITRLGRALEHRPQTLHLESHRRRNHRKGLPRPPNPPPDQITDGPLGPPSYPIPNDEPLVCSPERAAANPLMSPIDGGLSPVGCG